MTLASRLSPMGAMHFFLLLANTAIIYGGAQLAGATDLNDPGTIKQLHLSNALRTAGQSVFLACNVGLLATIVGTMVGRKMHPTLVLLLIVWFPLIIRGTFGVLQAAVYDVSVLFQLFPAKQFHLCFCIAVLLQSWVALISSLPRFFACVFFYSQEL
jgi:hypothetical protein